MVNGVADSFSVIEVAVVGTVELEAEKNGSELFALEAFTFASVKNVKVDVL